MSAVSVKGCTTSIPQGVRAGSIPSTALHDLKVIPVAFVIAKRLIEKHHYLHSLPGGTMLTFGVFLDKKLMGAATLGAGPYNAHCLIDDTKPEDCLTLTRLWLSDDLPSNSESRVIGIILRALKKNTSVRFIISYSDPQYQHVGTIYQATGWLYTGLSQSMPLYDLGSGKLHHSRSLGHVLGSHSISYLNNNGLKVKTIPQSGKNRYIYLLDQTLKSRLRVPVLPYLKKSEVGYGVRVCQ